jgi:hypothetical protein
MLAWLGMVPGSGVVVLGVDSVVGQALNIGGGILGGNCGLGDLGAACGHLDLDDLGAVAGLVWGDVAASTGGTCPSCA